MLRFIEGLTVKLTEPPRSPDQATWAHNLFRARGAQPPTVHRPLQRSLRGRPRPLVPPLWIYAHGEQPECKHRFPKNARCHVVWRQVTGKRGRDKCQPLQAAKCHQVLTERPGHRRSETFTRMSLSLHAKGTGSAPLRPWRKEDAVAFHVGGPLTSRRQASKQQLS